MPRVELPDVEAMVVAFLKTRTPVHIGSKVPETRPDEYVRAWRTGGAAVNRALEQAQITVTCTALSSTAAWTLTSEMRSALLNDYSQMLLVRGVEEVSGAYYDPDPDTNEDRYSFTIRMSVRAAR